MAAQAQAQTTQLIQQIRTAYQAERQTTAPEVRDAAIHMFEQVDCTRSGAVVTIRWPFDAELVRRYWAPH